LKGRAANNLRIIFQRFYPAGQVAPSLLSLFCFKLIVFGKKICCKRNKDF